MGEGRQVQNFQELHNTGVYIYLRPNGNHDNIFSRANLKDSREGGESQRQLKEVKNDEKNNKSWKSFKLITLFHYW